MISLYLALTYILYMCICFIFILYLYMLLILEGILNQYMISLEISNVHLIIGKGRSQNCFTPWVELQAHHRLAENPPDNSPHERFCPNQDSNPQWGAEDLQGGQRCPQDMCSLSSLLMPKEGKTTYWGTQWTLLYH